MSEHSHHKPYIDVVIPWVDGDDILWRAERDFYLSLEDSTERVSCIDARNHRFRSWDTLQYIFRGIEEYMPWVRKVHLVTNGQTPGWLKKEHPKLNLVRHDDYIPKEYLPTFNSHVIELNLHRIPDLSEYFIYFNDDTFIIRPMKETDFFSADNLPVDQFGLWRIQARYYNDVLPHVCVNNMSLLNQNFSQQQVLRTHRNKLLSPRNGAIHVGLTLLMSTLSRRGFANMVFHHMPAAFLKHTLQSLWDAEPQILHRTSSHKFRSKDDVSQYAARAWQMLCGNFEPRNISGYGKHFTYIVDDFSVVVRAIDTGRYRGRRLKMLCVSDEMINDFERAKQEIGEALERRLPAQSSFEIATQPSQSDIIDNFSALAGISSATITSR